MLGEKKQKVPKAEESNWRMKSSTDLLSQEPQNFLKLTTQHVFQNRIEIDGHIIELSEGYTV